MMSKWSAVVAVSALAVGVVLALPAAAAPVVAPAGNSSVAHAVSAQAQSAAVSHWTPARMAAARPADAQPVLLTGPAAAPAAAPVPQAAVVDIPAVLGSLAPAAPETLIDPVRRPYTQRLDRLNGKVFFTGADGFDYVCSGTVVNGYNKDLVDTAGHCVANGAGDFHENWVFVPGYSSTAHTGNAPFGIWSARNLATRTTWLVDGNLKQDLGYGVLDTLNGRHIVNYLGGHGTYFNVSRFRNYAAFGYPQAPPFNGWDQRVSANRPPVGFDNPQPALSGPLTTKIKSDKTGGVSGGGWFINLNPATSGLGHVVGHNSYRYVGTGGDPTVMYSPYYGADALSLYYFARVL